MNNGFKLGLILPSADYIKWEESDTKTATLPRETRSAASDLYVGRPEIVRQAEVSNPYAAEEEALQRIHGAVGLDLGIFNRETARVLRPTLDGQPDCHEVEVRARMAETTRVFEN